MNCVSMNACPARLPDLLKRFDTITLKLWEKHGIHQAGFWTTVIGESSQTLDDFVKWELLAERGKKWAAFGADPDWLSARAKTEKKGRDRRQREELHPGANGVLGGK